MWPNSCNRIETKAQTTHRSNSKKPNSMKVQPKTTITSQNSGWTRTSVPNSRKRRSYGVGAGSTSMGAGPPRDGAFRRRGLSQAPRGAAMAFAPAGGYGEDDAGDAATRVFEGSAIPSAPLED